MSAFGELNLDDVAESLPNGTYKFQLTNIVLRESKKEDRTNHFYILTWELNEEESEFVGEEVKQFLYILPNLPADFMKDPSVPAKDKAQARKTVNYYRSFMENMGVPDYEVMTKDIMDLKGEEAYLTVYTRSDGNIGIGGVKAVSLMEEGSFNLEV